MQSRGDIDVYKNEDEIGYCLAGDGARVPVAFNPDSPDDLDEKAVLDPSVTPYWNPAKKRFDARQTSDAVSNLKTPFKFIRIIEHGAAIIDADTSLEWGIVDPNGSSSPKAGSPEKSLANALIEIQV